MAKKQDIGYRHIFGPVPSRRLGLSLGVDLVPHKTCTLDCVYCECGKTTHLTVKRQEYVALKQIKIELDAFLTRNRALDFITFSGAGEPTLHSGLGEIVRYLKTAYPQQKLALLTNGTLLNSSSIRREISILDVVKVSLDAGYEKNFNRINRPHPGLDLTCFTDGLVAFRKEFAKQFWVEVFLVPGCNDSEVELKEIKNILNTLEPDRIQLNTLDRPGTEPWVKPAGKKALTDIASYLYNAEIITHSKPKQNGHIDGKNYHERLLATIKRRPCTAEDVTRLLGIDIIEARRHLYDLTHKGVIRKKEMPRGIFYMMPG